MKKGWKIFWIICASVFGLGLVLCITGAAMGGTREAVRRAYGDGRDYKHGFAWLKEDWDNRHDSDDWDNPDDWTDNPDDYEDYDNAAPAADGEDVTAFSGIRELEVDLNYLELEIKEGDGDDVKVDPGGIYEECRDRLFYETDDGELKITDSFSRSLWKELGRKDAGKLVIEVPKDRALEVVSLEIGAGEVTVENMNTGSMDISVGAGRAVVKKFDTKDLNVDCGAGQVQLNGDFTRAAEVECGVGEIELTLSGAQKDYDYKLGSGAGEIKIGNDRYNSLGDDREVNNKAGKHLDLECGIGSVSVSFAKAL